MPITIDGTGSITGLVAGGLPDASVATADLGDGVVTAPKLSGAQTGSAPVYAARAWVSFDGTGTVGIRSGGNVTSITDNGTGTYTINFITAFADTNYCAAAAASEEDSRENIVIISNVTTSTMQVRTRGGGGALRDSDIVNVVVIN